MASASPNDGAKNNNGLVLNASSGWQVPVLFCLHFASWPLLPCVLERWAIHTSFTLGPMQQTMCLCIASGRNEMVMNLIVLNVTHHG